MWTLKLWQLSSSIFPYGAVFFMLRKVVPKLGTPVNGMIIQMKLGMHYFPLLFFVSSLISFSFWQAIERLIYASHVICPRFVFSWWLLRISIPRATPHCKQKVSSFCSQITYKLLAKQMWDHYFKSYCVVSENWKRHLSLLISMYNGRRRSFSVRWLQGN